LILYKQLTALFARYIAAHFKADGQPMHIVDPSGATAGAIDVLNVQEGNLRLAGWTFADDIILHMNGIKVSTKADLVRDDVTKAFGGKRQVGFDLVAPLGPTGLHEIARFGVEFHRVREPSWTVATNLKFSRLWWIRTRLVFQFLIALTLQIPAYISWCVKRDPAYRAQIKRGLTLCTVHHARELDPDLFRTKVPPDTTASVTIILPVFNAHDLLKEALQRIVKNTDLPWRIILVEDCSTDKRVLTLLREWCLSNTSRATLLENDQNLGFVKSVNKGLHYAQRWSDTVILLNSDALVPAKWASRLIRPLLQYPRAATATPMSNDAEIFNAPLICAPQDLATGQGDLIDLTAAQLNPESYRVAVPTGVGFCMAINPNYLKKVPQFDISFGRGYGEEVDWCQRIRASDGLHYCAVNLFIEHRGGQSFGSEEKLRLIAKNNALISSRYPQYDNDVQQFIASDPLKSPRLALALAWLGAQDIYPVSIYFAHSMGGGAEAYLQHRLKSKHHALGRAAVVIRVGGAMRWQIEVHCQGGMISGGTNNLDYVAKLLRPIKARRLIYSCAVGDRNALSVPDAILTLSHAGQHTLEFLFHDYFAISPDYTLLNDKGVYDGLPRRHKNDIEAASAQIGLTKWQSEWEKLLKVSKEIIVFSENSKEIVEQAYPKYSEKIQVRPHRVSQELTRIPPPVGQKRRVIGVLGDIGLQKGAKVISRAAGAIDAQGVGLVIVGNFDPAIPLSPSVPIHGRYIISDLGKIAARYGVTDWLIPSVWPETFSFTTHEALATGLPTHAYAIGAQGDAVANAKNGFPIPYSTKEDLADILLAHIEAHIVKTLAVAS
jgi:GT2 family glycosyltransferase/glycosyltransferase involved in cell wall biosynthesis